MKRKNKCPYCLEEVVGKYFMVALEFPYKNLIFHVSCKDKVESELGMETFLKNNPKNWL